jgi:hypothetical protein
MFNQEIVIYQELVLFRMVKRDPDRVLGGHYATLSHFCLTIEVSNGNIMEAMLKLFKLIDKECGMNYYNPHEMIYTDRRPCITKISIGDIISAYEDEYAESETDDDDDDETDEETEDEEEEDSESEEEY